MARSYGNGLPEQLRDDFAHRFDMESQKWQAALKLDLADDLLADGKDAPWYQQALVELEAEAADGDVNSRLDTMADLIQRHARNGDLKAAQNIVIGMTSTAFGVGYRKDHQFDRWVSWLGRALVELDGNSFVYDAAWLARLLTSVAPMDRRVLHDPPQPVFRQRLCPLTRWRVFAFSSTWFARERYNTSTR